MSPACSSTCRWGASRVEGVPDGESWEVYTVLGDSQTFYDHDHSGPECCGADASQTGQPAESGAKCC